MKQTKTQRKRRIFSAMEKSQAVLSIWAERRTLTEVSKEMEVNSVMISKWQETAMEAMLMALQPKCNQKQKPPLNPRLEKLLERKYEQQNKSLDRLEQRLDKIQQNRPQKSKPIQKTQASS